jgi:hypothetical protein
MAPFTNYNGNTFAAIARIIIKRLDLDSTQEQIARSLAGHIVAGVASEEVKKLWISSSVAGLSAMAGCWITLRVMKICEKEMWRSS